MGVFGGTADQMREINTKKMITAPLFGLCFFYFKNLVFMILCEAVPEKIIMRQNGCLDL